jgi:hypothetical protein
MAASVGERLRPDERYMTSKLGEKLMAWCNLNKKKQDGKVKGMVFLYGKYP